MLLGQLMQCRKPKCSRNASEKHGISWHCNWGPFGHHVFCHLYVKRQISQIILCLKMRAPLRSYVGLAPLRSYVGLTKRRKTQSLSILTISYPDKIIQIKMWPGCFRKARYKPILQAGPVQPSCFLSPWRQMSNFLKLVELRLACPALLVPMIWLNTPGGLRAHDTAAEIDATATSWPHAKL